MKLNRLFQVATVGVLAATAVVGGVSTASAAPKPAPASATQQAPPPNREDVGSMVEVCSPGLKIWLNSQEVKDGGFKMMGAKQTGADLSFTVGLTKDRPVNIVADNMLISPATLKVHTDLVYDRGETNVADMSLKYRFVGDWTSPEGKDYKRWRLDIHHSQYQHEYVHNTNENDGVKGTIQNRTKEAIDLRLGAWGGQPVRLKPGEKLLYFDSHEFNHYRGMKFEVFPAGSHRWTTSAYLGDFFDNRKPVSEVYQHGKAVDIKHYERWERATFGDDQTGFTTTIERERGDALPTPHETGFTSDWPEFNVVITKK